MPPPLGRWTHQNPKLAVEDAVSFNRYAYANNDPVGSRDPSGDDPTIAFFMAAVPCALIMLADADTGAIGNLTEAISECIQTYVDESDSQQNAVALAEFIAGEDKEAAREKIVEALDDQFIAFVIRIWVEDAIRDFLAD